VNMNINPRKICAYGYGWEISCPRQAWLLLVGLFIVAYLLCPRKDGQADLTWKTDRKLQKKEMTTLNKNIFCLHEMTSTFYIKTCINVVVAEHLAVNG